MAYKKVGSLERGEFGWGYFICYCNACKNKIVVGNEQAQVIVNALYWKRHSVFYALKAKIREGLPRVRIVVERGDRGKMFTQLLTRDDDKNTMEYMKKKEIKVLSEKNKKILADRSTGKSIVELEEIYGLTRQRIWAILKRYGDTLPKELSTEA